GPQSPGWVFGLAKTVLDSTATTELYEHWAREYDPVYKVPGVFEQSMVVLSWADGESHKRLEVRPLSCAELNSCHFLSFIRQRKALSPAFSAVAIRSLTSVFHDAAHKTLIAWDSEIESNQSTHCAVIDVQQWMNHISLDSVGIAVLSHDFSALGGNDSVVGHVLNAFSSSVDVSNNLVILAQNFPFIVKLPLPRTQFSLKFRLIVGKICQEMLSRTRKEKETGGAAQGDKSCLGLLCESCCSFAKF
ncbi:hypothetical protein DFJ58DRAFT_661388, partial [Suillus subalutaceus]|uniref:uncharacterized protein n=1 Tax=Suillus subalutaceus TaxID=48586 RepID=UPI001B869C3E